jgi:hypothetical protein
MNQALLPDDRTEEEVMADFLEFVHEVCAHARTAEQRDRVTDALYDIFVGVDEDL